MRSSLASGQRTKRKEEPPRMICTHLIDGIYQGPVNLSYQRQGFGILQTDEFDTYMGWFKCNQAHGLGLIIYSRGSMLFGTFRNGQLEGLCLTDNGEDLKLGLVKNAQMVGIGFEYNYSQKQWSMNRYHKGVSIDTISSEAMGLEQGVPQILGLESQLLGHFLRYRNREYFQKNGFTSNNQDSSQNLNNFYFHPLSQTHHFFGAFISDQYEGLGLVYHPKLKKVIEVGTYKEGVLHGYGLEYSVESLTLEIGFFIEGKKSGVFFYKIERKDGKFIEYDHGSLISKQTKSQNRQSFRKRQKIHSYQQRGFLSMRHNLAIDSLNELFEDGQHKAWRLQAALDIKQGRQVSKAPPPEKPKRSTPKSQNSPMLTGQDHHSCLTIMKKKIRNLTSQKTKQGEEKASPMIQEGNSKEKQKKVMFQVEDDEIAMEQNPIGQQMIMTIATRLPNVPMSPQLKRQRSTQNE